jgi:hypothetical protein
MKTARVQIYGMTGKYVVVDTDATDGATVGVNLFWPDGSKVTEAQLRSAISGAGSSPASAAGTSDEVDEGQYNLYFTVKRAQDAVGGILTDTDTIDFTYDGTAHFIKADLKDLADSGVGAALVRITRDPKGRISGTHAATTSDLSEGTNLYFTNARVGAALAQGTGVILTVDPTTKVTTISATGGGGGSADLATIWASL